MSNATLGVPRLTRAQQDDVWKTEACNAVHVEEGDQRQWFSWLVKPGNVKLIRYLLDGDSVAQKPTAVFFTAKNKEGELSVWLNSIVLSTQVVGELFEIRFKDQDGNPCIFFASFDPSSGRGKKRMLSRGTANLDELTDIVLSRPTDATLIVLDAITSDGIYRYLCSLS